MLLRSLLAALAALLLTTAAHAEGALRLAIVNTPKISGLIDDLIADFKAGGGGDVTVYGGNDVYDKARAGEADLVISHYGKAEVEHFVLDGFGAWPRMVFANQLAIVGPQSDPAGIRGLTSAAEALRKMAAAQAPFAVNALPGVAYLSEILWLQAGSPAKGPWYLDPGVAKGQAMTFAEERQAYSIWGAIPFQRFKKKHASQLELMVTADPLLQRVMAAVVVKAEKVPNVNMKGAQKFVGYLLSPRGQARIAAFRSPGVDVQLWWPAGRNNSSEGLDE